MKLYSILRGKLPKEFLLLMIFYSIPRFMELLLPLCFYLATSLTIGRMYAESEMSVISACGISALRMTKIVLIPAFFIAATVGFISLYLAPHSMAKVYELLVNPENYRSFNLRSEGRMQTSQGGRGVSHIGKIDRDTDEIAHRALARHFPDREIVMLNVDVLGEIGGGIHCATHQMPA